MKVFFSIFVTIFFGISWEVFLFLILLYYFYFFFSLEGDITNLYFNYDVYRIVLILLRLFIRILILVSSLLYIKKFFYWREFVFIIYFLIILLILVFSFSNVLIFYIRFEIVIIPTFLLILGWGFNRERLQAGLYILLYTIFASLPFLFLLINFFLFSKSYFFFLFTFFSAEKISFYWYIFIRFVFLVKLPVFLVHIWLPKAHVEAPLAGSIILAGVLLKLGGYGFFKIFIFFRINYFLVQSYFLRLRLLGSLFISFVCMRQVDIKCLIAYSSVSHMGPVLASLISFNFLGWIGAFWIIISHGICSSGLFFGLNLIYERFFTRRIIIIKGLFILMPVYVFFWFRLTISNISCPPSINFFSEILIIFSLLRNRKIILLPLAILLFMRGLYSVYLFSLIVHGDSSVKRFYFFSLDTRDMYLFLRHSFPIFFLYFFFDLLK